MLPQRDESFRSARRRIDAANEFLARSFDGLGKRGQSGRAGRAFVRGRGATNVGFVG